MRRSVPRVLQIEQIRASVLFHHLRTMKGLTNTQLSAVPCPTCGVPAGHRCVLHSGAPRFEPHTDRKLVAAEALAKKRRKRK